MEFISCQLCQKMQWEQIMDSEFGLWDRSNKELKREVNYYPIGLCAHCHHVQLMTTLSHSYFSQMTTLRPQESIFWHESLVHSQVPFEQMIELFATNIRPHSTVVDFGAGYGTVLSILRKKYGPQDIHLLGIDLNNQMPDPSLDYLYGDLNDLSLAELAQRKEIDVAILAHVLKRVIDPITLLKSVVEMLAPSGIIFIEVPDFSNPKSIGRHAGLSNLVSLQRIHYFTKDSLIYLAERVGCKIVKLRQLVTGYIPRLQVVLEKTETPQHHQKKINTSAVAAVTRYQVAYEKRRTYFKSKMREHIDEYGKIGLWGTGADFFKLVHQDDELDEYITQGKITLFDLTLAGHTYKHKTIISSELIERYNFPVFITPALAETRSRMHQINHVLGANVIDIYREWGFEIID